MYCLLSEEEKAKKRKNREINKELRSLSNESKKKLKLLLLGTGDSGKSTLIKQMRILYGKPFTSADRNFYKTIIFNNILTSIQAMVKATMQLGIFYENRESAHLESLIAEVKSLTSDNVSDYLTPIKTLWQDEGIKKCYLQRNEYYLLDSAQYYLDAVDRIFSKNYIPSDQDILRARTATTGIINHQFKISKKIFEIIDVGGQRSERRKWLHCFDNVTAILFVAALSEYNQVLSEANVNRMTESIDVFANILNSIWFKKTTVILFLNKTDILAEKIKNSHLIDYFSEYIGPQRDAEAARVFICDMFRNVQPKRRIYIHFTCATDTQSMKEIFQDVRHSIINQTFDLFMS